VPISGVPSHYTQQARRPHATEPVCHPISGWPAHDGVADGAPANLAPALVAKQALEGPRDHRTTGLIRVDVGLAGQLKPGH